MKGTWELSVLSQQPVSNTKIKKTKLGGREEKQQTEETARSAQTKPPASPHPQRLSTEHFLSTQPTMSPESSQPPSLTAAERGRYPQSHFAEEETEGQRGTSPRSASWKVVELDWNPGPPSPSTEPGPREPQG